MRKRSPTPQPSLRPPIDTQRGGGASRGPRVIDDWSRSGDATKSPTFVPGFKGKQKKPRKWPY
jgi:hypothetical protein